MSNQFPQCKHCGVFYTVGLDKCDVEWCPSNIKIENNENEKISNNTVTIKIKKKYPHKKIPITMSRWVSIVSRSKKRGYECDITHDDIVKLIDLPCVYCGSSNRIEVDRMDNDLGYIKSNIAPACHRCNTIKNNVVSYDEMMFIAEYLGWRR